MNKNEWFIKVYELANSFGYSNKQVSMFIISLTDHFENGLTPEEAAEIEF